MPNLPGQCVALLLSIALFSACDFEPLTPIEVEQPTAVSQSETSAAATHPEVNANPASQRPVANSKPTSSGVKYETPQEWVAALKKARVSGDVETVIKLTVPEAHKKSLPEHIYRELKSTYGELRQRLKGIFERHGLEFPSIEEIDSLPIEVRDQRYEEVASEAASQVKDPTTFLIELTKLRPERVTAKPSFAQKKIGIEVNGDRAILTTEGISTRMVLVKRNGSWYADPNASP